jgi:hypothetical protein
VVVGLTPIAVAARAPPVSLAVVGRNFQDARSVRVIPPDGVTVGQEPTANADGTQLSVSIAAAASAGRGPRTVVVVTAAGETSSTQTEANALSIVQSLGTAVSPLLSDPVRVVRQIPGAGEPPLSFGPLLSREVRVTLTQAAPQPRVEHRPASLAGDPRSRPVCRERRTPGARDRRDHDADRARLRPRRCDDPYQSFIQYLKLSDDLIESSTKELIAETARVLALMVAGYQAKFGEIPAEESLRLLRPEKLNDEDAAMLPSGLETLVGILGALREEASDDRGASVH